MDDDGSLKKVVTSLYSKATKQQEKMIEQVRIQLEEFINSSLIPISGRN
jgi:hypothetical protein